MPLDLDPLQNAPRLLFDVELKPLMGSTFQPTGFPDLGAASYQDGQGTACLLVESAQSMANRLENTLWDEGENDLIAPAAGLSHVRVERDGAYLTSSITEAHRLNSGYITSNKEFFAVLKDSLGGLEKGPIDRKLLHSTLLRLDANCLLHGVFFADGKLAGGRLRVARALSSIVEARGVVVAASGGVKNDHVNPQGAAKDGFGNVPFARDEYAAERITASFCLDLQQVRAYGLGADAERLLTVLALYKIRALLDGHLRFRTRCDLEVAPEGPVTSRRPAGFELPTLDTLTAELPGAIAACADRMETTTVPFSA